MPKFDLNIDKILEAWSTQDALREIIANALDEQTLTRSRDIEISQDSQGRWHIRDFGRGLRYDHLAQKENDEKLRHPHLIGRFGIGLKDALATFDRRTVAILIKSSHADISLARSSKHGFDDVVTLHADVTSPSSPGMVGTDVIVSGCSRGDVEAAKSRFVRFSGERPLERTKLGDILERNGGVARIYINGVLVAEEENFLFSYNITSLTKAIKAALNRERRNVGRAAYSDRIKDMLLACRDTTVANALVGDLNEYDSGRMHDELKWTDVSVHACKLLNARAKVVFFTPADLVSAKDVVEDAIRGGYRPVTVPGNIRERLSGQRDTSGNVVRDLRQFMKELHESFEFEFVKERDLTLAERRVFRLTSKILKLVGGKPRVVKDIRISETMRREDMGLEEALGLWEAARGWIVIKRTQLQSPAKYAGTLLHEVAHAQSGAKDVSREFESELTAFLGKIASGAIH